MHLSRHILPLIVCAAALPAATVAEHMAAYPKAYACDMTITTSGKPMAMRQVVDGDQRMRIDLTSPMAMSIIIRHDQGKTYTLLGKTAMVKPLDAKEAQSFAAPKLDTGVYEVAPDGEETIDGVACDRFVVTAKPGRGGRTGKMWIGRADHAMRKYAADDGRVAVTITGYSFAAPQADLFEIPAGYTRQDMTAPAK